MRGVGSPRGPFGRWERLQPAILTAFGLHVMALYGAGASRSTDPPDSATASVPTMTVRYLPVSAPAGRTGEALEANRTSVPEGLGAPAAAPDAATEAPIAVREQPFVPGSGAGIRSATALPHDRRDTVETTSEGAGTPVPPKAPVKPVSGLEAALAPAPDYLSGPRLDPGPRALDDIEPEYPDAAQLQEGTVVLRLLIDETGKIDNIAVVRAAPKGLFERPALEAFSRARFAPGYSSGNPVKSQITVEVHFVPINRGSRISGRGY